MHIKLKHNKRKNRNERWCWMIEREKVHEHVIRGKEYNIKQNHLCFTHCTVKHKWFCFILYPFTLITCSCTFSLLALVLWNIHTRYAEVYLDCTDRPGINEIVTIPDQFKRFIIKFLPVMDKFHHLNLLTWNPWEDLKPWAPRGLWPELPQPLICC